MVIKIQIWIFLVSFVTKNKFGECNFSVFTRLQVKMEKCNGNRTLALDNILPYHSCSPPRSPVFFDRLMVYTQGFHWVLLLVWHLYSGLCCVWLVLAFFLQESGEIATSNGFPQLLHSRPERSHGKHQVLWSEVRISSSLLFCL